MNERDLLQQVCDAYRRILGEKLAGFYVHGSIAFEPSSAISAKK